MTTGELAKLLLSHPADRVTFHLSELGRHSLTIVVWDELNRPLEIARLPLEGETI